MARRIFLHIGTPKSGTTYLQARLAANRALLTQQGIEYPDLGSGDHFEPALDLIDRRWGGRIEQARGQWAQLVALAQRTDQDVLISHEILAAASAEQAQKALRDFADRELHIVLTARDLARQIPAEWQQRVKHRRRSSFKRFSQSVMGAARTHPDLWFWKVQSIPDILTRWGHGLNPDHIHLVTVPPAGASPDELWRRFCQVVGLEPALEYVAAEQFNRSLGLVGTNVLRRLNQALADYNIPREQYIKIVRQLIAHDVLAAGERLPVYLPESLRPFVAEVTQEWLEWLQGAGVDVVGSLTELEPHYPEPDTKHRHPDNPPGNRTAQAAIEALAVVVNELAHIPDPPPLQRMINRITP